MYSVDRQIPDQVIAGCEVCSGVEMPPEFVPVTVFGSGVAN